jgi:hypothetical protein
MASAHDTSYQTGIYVKQGGQELHIGNQVAGPDGTGAAVVVGPNSIAAPLTATFSPAAGSANVCLVTVQLKDGLGNNCTGPYVLDVWLSDASTGIGLTATTASGAVAAGASGTDLGVLTTKKANRVLTDAAGKYILSITDTSKTGFYVAASTALNMVGVSSQLVTANYG